MRASQTSVNPPPVQSSDFWIIPYAAFRNSKTIAEGYAISHCIQQDHIRGMHFTDIIPLGIHHRKDDRLRVDVRFSSYGLLSRVSLGY